MEQAGIYLQELSQKLCAMLEQASCIKGYFYAECAAGHLRITMHGTRAGKTQAYFFWEWPHGVKGVLIRLFEDYEDIAALELQLDTAGGVVQQRFISRREYDAQKEKEARQKQADIKQAQLKKRAQLSARTRHYGSELAQKVTEQLLKGHFMGHSHRDYCGTGLEKNPLSGKIVYGEIYDGGIILVLCEFETPEAFTQWLALQSDASMALLDSAEPFYWGNQTITEERLREFVR